jgi:hypothetical protein
MIIPINTDEHSWDGYIICLRAPMTVAEIQERMLQRAKASRGSYAYQLVDNLHAHIFVQSLDLKADYEAYFAREYETFSAYLCRREHFQMKVVTRLVAAFDMSIGMYYYEPRYTFLSGSYGIEFLTRLIEDEPDGAAA